MRLDHFLKLARIVKQRSAAKEACDSHRVEISGRKAKAATDVRVGDEITVNLRDRFLRVQIREIPTGNVSRSRAADLYEVVEERSIPRR